MIIQLKNWVWKSQYSSCRCKSYKDMKNQHTKELISAWEMPQTQQQRWVAYGNSPGMQQGKEHEVHQRCVLIRIWIWLLFIHIQATGHSVWFHTEWSTIPVCPSLVIFLFLTRGQYGRDKQLHFVKESALNFDPEWKIPCCLGESNLRQQRARPDSQPSVVCPHPRSLFPAGTS